jgi:hypothetical protein
LDEAFLAVEFDAAGIRVFRTDAAFADMGL